MILPHILKTIWWRNVVLAIMDQCDKKINLVKYVGQWPIFHGPLILPYIIVIDLNYFYTLTLGIPVMRYERAARPCALNFRLAALKCRFGRPPNALSSVCVWPSMPPLCASFIQNVITLTGHLFIGKKCGVSKHSYLSINLKLFR